MSIIEDYLKSAGGNWLKAENIQDGYKVKIQQVWLDDETFDKPYICIGGINAQKEEVRVRLGVQNVQRISEVLGTNAKEWENQYLEVVGTQAYPGLSSKGILWRGVKKQEEKPKPKQEEF
jgi:hypothetical protein